MKKMLGVCVVVGTVLTNIKADEWIKNYGPGYGRCIQQTQDGGYIVATFIIPLNSPDSIGLIKIDSIGNVIWEKTFTTDTVGKGPCGIRQTSDKGYVIVANRDDINYHMHPASLIKTDSLGNILWEKEYSELKLEWVEQTQDKGYIMTGAKLQGVLVKTDSLGDTLWSKEFPGLGCYRVFIYPDGGYGVIAHSGFSEYSDIFLIRTDSLGNTLWEKSYGEDYWNISYWGDLTNDGGVIIAGSGYSLDPMLIKVDSSGDVEWEKGYNIRGGNVDCVHQTFDGGYAFIVTCEGFSYPGLWLVKTNSTGDTLWKKNFLDIKMGSETERVSFFEQTKDSEYIITGASYYPEYIYVIKTSSSVGIEENSSSELDKSPSTKLQIAQNPFIKSTIIKYFIPVRTQVILSVYDITGSCVKTLVNGEKTAGSYSINLNANELKTGIYFVRLTADKYKLTKKLILMK
ncbi:MAG: T9SS type A sorting domain-containing protein [bacterium]|nr:T9SS type A sorting domain-containing protein [bacterium]